MGRFDSAASAARYSRLSRRRASPWRWLSWFPKVSCLPKSRNQLIVSIFVAYAAFMVIQKMVYYLSCNNSESTKFQYDYLARERSVRVSRGGYHEASCGNSEHWAVIVAYKNDDSTIDLLGIPHHNDSLSIYLANLHRFLQNTGIGYTLFLVEQRGGEEMARGLLFNMAFSIASESKTTFTCFVFHDAFMVAKRQLQYRCDRKGPRVVLPVLERRDGHQFRMETVDKFAHNVVFSMTKEQMTAVNGFSNLFPGFSGEDDDLCHRANLMNYSLVRVVGELFYDVRPRLFSARSELFKSTEKRLPLDGLSNSNKFCTTTTVAEPGHTHILVRVDEASILEAWKAYALPTRSDLNNNGKFNNFHCV